MRTLCGPRFRSPPRLSTHSASLRATRSSRSARASAQVAPASVCWPAPIWPALRSSRASASARPVAQAGAQRAMRDAKPSAHSQNSAHSSRFALSEDPRPAERSRASTPLAAGPVLRRQLLEQLFEPFESDLGVAAGAGPLLKRSERPSVPLPDDSPKQCLPGAQAAPQPPDRYPKVVQTLLVLRIEGAGRGLPRLREKMERDQTYSLLRVPPQQIGRKRHIRSV